MASALSTDLYELNMAASYLRRGMTGSATFSLFVRQLPPQRGFLVAAGLDSCLAFLEAFRFTADDLDWLRDRQGFDSASLDAFSALRFTGDVWAVPEGRIVFADEPILEVTAPLAEGQLVETYLLNTVTFATTIASKAARCVIAAEGREVVDFSFRRTQGRDAAMTVARSSAIVGFEGTSNVEAARHYGLRAVGTMAHSYIQAFPSERDAFRAFAEDYPHRTTFLVDTFDTLEGVRNAIAVAAELGLRENVGVRLDSGDLAQLARDSRKLLDAAGLTSARILASGSLDELEIERLVRDSAPIDAFGVGTRMGVSADAPSLDSVYKLVAYDGRPVMKLSPAKVTAPGSKQVFRTAGRVLGDVLGLRDEPPDPLMPGLLKPAMRRGRRLGPPDSVASMRARFEADLARLPEAARRIRQPHQVTARRSAQLLELTERTEEQIEA